MSMRKLTILLLFMLSAQCVADEIRPGFLQLKETSQDIFSALWKVPAKGDKRLGIYVGLPENCENQTKANSQLVNNAYIERWIVSCEGGLLEKAIAINGLNQTSTDVLLHLEFADGRSESAHLTPTNSIYQVPAETSAMQVVTTYTWLGIEHILIGIDHLLFVFALLLITGSGWKLVKTVTAFTLAHSITLGLATLGLVHVPPTPVEAVIALSIVFLAVEIVKAGQGKPGLSYRAPWLVALIFGLVHGFGFAGALSEIGLPQGQIPLALLFFNVGVELGQLIFIGVVFTSLAAMRYLRLPLQNLASPVAAYAIGSIAMFWMMQRLASF